MQINASMSVGRLAQRNSTTTFRARQPRCRHAALKKLTTVAQALPNSSSSNSRKGAKKSDVSTNAMVVEAPPAPESPRQQKKMLRMLIDGQWYDVTGWAKAHPSGARFIEFMDGRDATDAFYALHSYGPNGDSTAAKNLAKLPKCAAPEGWVECSAKTAAACSTFREFRVQLEEAGWFERDFLSEAFVFLQVVGLFVAGTALAWTNHPWLATLVLGFGGQQAGWLGHDYIHGRGAWCTLMRGFAGLFNGHSAYWWSQKHNMHHVFTNEYGKDEDVQQEPVYYLRPPEEVGSQDSPLRKFQHIYGYPTYAITFLYWRFDSLKTVLRTKDKIEMALLAINYLWMLTLGPAVAIGHVALAGFLVGALVSATHQSEEMMDEQGEFVDVQFRSTRDAEVSNPFVKWCWGGMDTQLEHHLFPTMPRYKLHKLRPLVQSFAEANGFDYKIAPGAKIIADNWRTLRDNAHA